jgi:hypothetical protein
VDARRGNAVGHLYQGKCGCGQQIKQQLRTAAQRTQDGLHTATAQALEAISDTHAHGFYAHCGFPLAANYYDGRSTAHS